MIGLHKYCKTQLQLGPGVEKSISRCPLPASVALTMTWTTTVLAKPDILFDVGTRDDEHGTSLDLTLKSDNANFICMYY